ncbi:hypothetical protein ACFQYP_22000 [Nonomuraea antimicrobica]
MGTAARGFTDLLNLETGERDRAVVRTGETDVVCDSAYCVLSREGRWFVRRRDGSQERPMNQSALIQAPGMGRDVPFAGRVQVAMSATAGYSLIDLATGEAGDFGIRPGADGMLVIVGLVASGGLVSYELGVERVVIDLESIP